MPQYGETLPSYLGLLAAREFIVGYTTTTDPRIGTTFLRPDRVLRTPLGQLPILSSSGPDLSFRSV